MPKQVAAAQKLFLSAKADFFKLAVKTDKAITKERDTLKRKLKQANNKLKKTRTQLLAAEKKLQKTGVAAAKSQVDKMNKLVDEAKSEAIELRETLHDVGERMRASKEFSATAKFFQRGIDKLDKEWEKHIEKKEKNKPKVAAAKKATKKKAVKKKAVKKKIATKKATKKKVVQKKAAKKTTTKKKSTTKKKAAKK